LVISSGTRLNAWMEGNAPESAGDVEADSDGDGVSNLIEFVLGGTKETEDQDKLPTFEFTESSVSFAFYRDQTSIAPSIRVSVESCGDLAGWSQIYEIPDDAFSDSVITVIKDAQPGYDKVIVNAPKGADETHRYFRLHVILAP